MILKANSLGAKSQHYCPWVMSLRASYLISLSLSLFISEMGRAVVYSPRGEERYDNITEACGPRCSAQAWSVLPGSLLGGQDWALDLLLYPTVLLAGVRCTDYFPSDQAP